MHSNFGSLDDFLSYEAPISPTSGAPSKRNKTSSIDSHKYKTKLCRNFIMGVPCPFEDRCVFAHGEDQLVAPSVSGPENHVRDAAPLPPPSYTASITAGAVNFPSPQKRSSAPPPPPTYNMFMREVVSAVAGDTTPSPADTEPSTPPASPPKGARFRYEPYSTTAIVFE